MPRLDEPIDVRRDTTHDGAPTEFLWRGRLWQVRAVVSHRVEGRPWWTAPGVRAVVGAEGSSQDAVDAIGAAGRREGANRGGVATLEHCFDHGLDRVTGNEIWRVEAHWPLSGGRQSRPPLALGETDSGVFDLVLSQASGCWRLSGCED